MHNIRSGSSKFIDFSINQKCVCNFLLVINSNLGSILHRFRDCWFSAEQPSRPYYPKFGDVAIGLDHQLWGSKERGPNLYHSASTSQTDNITIAIQHCALRAYHAVINFTCRVICHCLNNAGQRFVFLIIGIYCACSGICGFFVTIDPICFLAGCPKKPLN